MEFEKLKTEILAGKIFIYPTDTIYGLGCDATNTESVEKIKKLKERDREKPLSIIAPSITWIKKNLIIEEGLDIKKYLPGPYTLLLKKKDINFMNHVSSNTKLGVRIPNNKFCRDIMKIGIPFITTSVNLSGEPFALKISDINPEILKSVDYIIEAEKESELSGKPSTLIIDGKEMERR